MSTFGSKEIVDVLIAADGCLHPEDPPCVKIVEYNPKIIWRRKS